MAYVRKFPTKILPQIDLSTGKRIAMLERNLRIVKKISLPVVGICERCNAKFESNFSDRAADEILTQFDAHHCEPRA